MSNFIDSEIEAAKKKFEIKHFKRPIGVFYDSKGNRSPMNKSGMCEDYILVSENKRSHHIELYFKEGLLEITKKEGRWIEELRSLSVPYFFVTNEVGLKEQLEGFFEHYD